MVSFGMFRVAACAASLLLVGAVSGETLAQGSAAAPMEERITKLLPELETYLQAAMKAFNVPGASVGIVQGDKLIYAKGFGLRERGKTDSVGAATIFQIGSTTKAFLGVTFAQAVDANKLEWNDRVVDVFPDFALSDPWMTREFRIVDIAAQRSGLTPYVNDGLSMLGYDEATLIRSLRYAPVTRAFRSDFTYLNIPHVVGGRLLAEKAELPSWADVVKKGVLDPLGMSSTSATPEAIEKAADHAIGHRATANEPVAVPFHRSFPYALGPAGALNSNVPDMAQWLRLQLGRGQFGDKVIVSEKNLDVTWTPRVAMSERTSYAVGWVVTATPNGRIIWHNGGTAGFGAHVGFLPDRDVGIIILTNLENTGLPDAVAQWFYDRLLDNTTVDNVALALEAYRARAQAAKDAAPKAIADAKTDLSTYVGTYASPLLGEGAVSVGDSKVLQLTLESDAVLRLDPLYADTFSAKLMPTNGFAPMVAMGGDDSITPVQFERDERGAIVRMHWLEPSLPQVFNRRP